MSHAKDRRTEKQVEIKDLKLPQETPSELTETEAQSANGGIIAILIGLKSQPNANL